MRRGEIWTASGAKDYAGKPRPVVIVQGDAFETLDSVTVRAFTTVEDDAPFFRVAVASNAENGLRSDCRMMIDKITTIPKSKLGSRIGQLDDTDMARLNHCILIFLDRAASPRHGAAP